MPRRLNPVYGEGRLEQLSLISQSGCPVLCSFGNGRVFSVLRHDHKVVWFLSWSSMVTEWPWGSVISLGFSRTLIPSCGCRLLRAAPGPNWRDLPVPGCRGCFSPSQRNSVKLPPALPQAHKGQWNIAKCFHIEIDWREMILHDLGFNSRWEKYEM